MRKTLFNSENRRALQPGKSIYTRCQSHGSLAVITFVAMLLLFISSGSARAYTNEVYKSGALFYWKVNNVVGGSSPELATAVDKCLWQSTGVGREIHILAGGNMASTIGLPGDVKVYCHGNSFVQGHTDPSIFFGKGANNIGVYDMVITTGGYMPLRFTRCNNITLSGITILGGYIGIRVEAHESRPWEFWNYGLTVTNCRFENLGSHGLETYGIDGFTINNVVARNNGECGVLINKGYNGTIGTVDAYRCSYNGGYAGLRFANDCNNITVANLIATECGRGFFTVSTVKNCTVQNLTIGNCTAHAILLQNSDNVVIAAGTFNGDGLNHYTSVNCQINAIPIGLRRITNAASGRALDVNENADGSLLRIWDYGAGGNQKWDVGELGGGRYSIRTSQTGGRGLDSSWNPVNGTATYIWNYWNGDPQKWQIQSVGNSRFRLNSHLNSTLCLDAAGTTNGSGVVMWSYWGGTNQQWNLGWP